MSYVTAILLIFLYYLTYTKSLRIIFNYFKFGKIKQIVNSYSILNFTSIILAIVSLALTLDDSFKINILNNSDSLIIPILLASLIIIVLLLNHINYKNEEIISLKNDLKSETKNLWTKYGELDSYYKKKNLRSTLQYFVQNTPNVISVQEYSYVISVTNEGLQIVINGLNGFIKESVDLNTVSQSYFKFKTLDIEKLLKVYAQARKSLITNNYSDDNYDEAQDLYVEWLDELSSKRICDYTDEDAIKFQLILIIKELVETGLNNQTVTLDPFLDEEQINNINRRKSGIEIAIFILRDYLNIPSKIMPFAYKGLSDSKKNRLYSNVQVINKLNINHVFVIAHHSDLNLDNLTRTKRVNTDTEKFITLIKNEFDT